MWLTAGILGSHGVGGKVLWGVLLRIGQGWFLLNARQLFFVVEV